jgi:hypothetical protein
MVPDMDSASAPAANNEPMDIAIQSFFMVMLPFESNSGATV